MRDGQDRRVPGFWVNLKPLSFGYGLSCSTSSFHISKGVSSNAEHLCAFEAIFSLSSKWIQILHLLAMKSNSLSSSPLIGLALIF